MGQWMTRKEMLRCSTRLEKASYEQRWHNQCGDASRKEFNLYQIKKGMITQNRQSGMLLFPSYKKYDLTSKIKKIINL